MTLALGLPVSVLVDDKASVERKTGSEGGRNLYRISRHGGCELRAVAFPANVNQLVGLIEYAIVTESGKVHESFYPQVKPSDIHAGLLRWREDAGKGLR